METSVAMARIAVQDGITHLACTPHIYPPSYNNTTASIQLALVALQNELDKQSIPLRLLIGADTHLLPETMHGLKTGIIPTLNYSRYFLLEPSHHVPVNNFVDQIENFINAGFVPIITHPERLKWIDGHYETFLQAAHAGAWLQVTAGAVTGHFGRSAQKWAERFFTDGYVHILASDAHGTDKRPPVLSAGMKVAASLLEDADEAYRLVAERPQAILDNVPAQHVLPPPALRGNPIQRPVAKRPSWLSRIFS